MTTEDILRFHPARGQGHMGKPNEHTTLMGAACRISVPFWRSIGCNLEARICARFLAGSFGGLSLCALCASIRLQERNKLVATSVGDDAPLP